MWIKCFTCRGKIWSIRRNTQHCSSLLNRPGGFLELNEGWLHSLAFSTLFTCSVHMSLSCQPLENRAPLNVWKIQRLASQLFVCVCFCVCLRWSFPEMLRADFLSRPCGNRAAVRLLPLLQSVWTLMGIVSFSSWTALGFYTHIRLNSFPTRSFKSISVSRN